MLAMIFSLGLIHGLGLSTRLQQLPLNPDQLLMNIISFNVGIELGQISALAIMLLLITAFRKSHFFPTFSKISNYFLILAGTFLFLMQMHGYEHTANAEGFVSNSVASQQQTDIETIKQSNWKDTIVIIIPARGEKEYKLQLAKGKDFEYTWQTDKGKLFFDFHGEPAGDTAGYFKSFKKDTKSSESGVLTTIFEGTHGWYWKNSHAFPVVITLKVAGEYQRLDLAFDNQKTPAIIKPTHDTLD
jgi:hypothetical protein